jgi:hypothetical protein
MCAPRSAAGVADAQHTLKQAVAPLVAALTGLEAELAGWFAARPPVQPARLEEGLGEHQRVAIDRILMVSGRLQTRVITVVAETRRVGAALAQPLDRAALDVEIRAVKDLEAQVSTLKGDHARWHTLRAQLAPQHADAAATATAQANWMTVTEERGA